MTVDRATCVHAGDQSVRVPFGPHPAVERLVTPFDGSVVAMPNPGVRGTLLGIIAATRAVFGASYDPATKQVTDTHLQPQGRYDDPSTITSAEVKVTSYDGTLVPLTIVYPKRITLDGSHPAQLMGYGAYGQSSDVGFTAQELAILERGAVLAQCHVRGGGEYGEEWHVAGMKLTKPNSWRDFIACAEYLVSKGYTSPRTSPEKASAPVGS